MKATDASSRSRRHRLPRLFCSKETSRCAAAEQVPNAEPLSKTYRVTRAKDVEFQKIAAFKVFDNLFFRAMYRFGVDDA